MPSETATLETNVDSQKVKQAVLSALDSRGYRVEQEFESKIVAKHAFSAAYYPHQVQVQIEPKLGKTVILATIDHRAGQTYLKRLVEELAKTLPPLPTRVFNPLEKPTSQQQLNYQTKMLNSNLNPGEQVIWSHNLRKGVFDKEVTEKWLITNMRAIKIYPVTKDNPQEKFTAVGWLDLSDSVVMNQIHRAKGNRVGAFEGTSRDGVFAGTVGGVSSSVSMSFGDLVFLHNDREVLRFQGISDPNDVNRMVKTLKKEYDKQATA